METKEKKVLDVLKNADKPLKTAEVAKGAGIDTKDVSKIISKLKKEGLVTSPKRCYYTAS